MAQIRHLDARPELGATSGDTGYDGMLTAGELASLRWSDVKRKQDGTGAALLYMSSGTTIETGPLSTATMELLTWLKGAADDDDPVIGLTPQEVEQLVSDAAFYAGMGRGFNALSVRAGAAQDMVDRAHGSTRS